MLKETENVQALLIVQPFSLLGPPSQQFLIPSPRNLNLSILMLKLVTFMRELQ